MLTPEYIIGLVDGEGCFTVYVRDEIKASKKRRAKVEPRFFVKLQAEDKPVLNALRQYFGCGNVYIQKDRRRNHRLCYRYEIANRKDLKVAVVPFFRKWPLRLPSKKRDFRLFCQIMELIDRNAHFSEEGMQQIRCIKSQMH